MGFLTGSPPPPSPRSRPHDAVPDSEVPAALNLPGSRHTSRHHFSHLASGLSLPLLPFPSDRPAVVLVFCSDRPILCLAFWCWPRRGQTPHRRIRNPAGRIRTPPGVSEAYQGRIRGVSGAYQGRIRGISCVILGNPALRIIKTSPGPAGPSKL